MEQLLIQLLLKHEVIYQKVVEKPLNFDPFGQVEFAPLALM